VVAGEREKPFVIGVKNPRADGLILKLSMKDMAAVSSGDYQRLREYEGKRYHHIIDIGTLYPADYGIAQVTLIVPDSAFADFLSTTIFLMDYDTGRAFAEENGHSVVWVMDDGEIRMTDVAKGMAVN
jgi:thiamine biosynthesis lipoprotein